MILKKGKRYMTRTGRITSPIVFTTYGGWPCSATVDGQPRCWEFTGEYMCQGKAHDYDLVEEYVEPVAPAPKIIQILLTPNDATWQGRLIGLGDDGVIYHDREGAWVQLIPSLSR